MYKVLIVDDDASIRELLELALSGPGIETVAVGSFSEAVRALRDRRFDLAVLDVYLTSGNRPQGLELLCRLLDVTPTTRALVISGSGEEHLGRLARGLGAVGFERKPLDLVELRQKLITLGLPRGYAAPRGDAHREHDTAGLRR